MSGRPPSIPSNGMKRLQVLTVDPNEPWIDTVFSHETLKVVVEHETEIEVKCDEERQSTEDSGKAAAVEQRDIDTSALASAPDAAASNSNPLTTSPKANNPATMSRRARMRGNRILKFAPLRFRAALASVARSPTKASSEGTRACEQSKDRIDEARDAAEQKIAAQPVAIPVDKKDSSDDVVSETSFSSVFGKKHLAIREQSLDRRILALERHLERVSSDKEEPICDLKLAKDQNKDISSFERLTNAKNQRNESFDNDCIEDRRDPATLTSWLSDQDAEPDSGTDDSDEESHATFHSFLVNNKTGKFESYRGTFSYDGTDTDGSYDADGDAFDDPPTFSFNSEDDEDTLESQTDGSHSYTDGGDRTDDSFTDEEEGEEIDRVNERDTGKVKKGSNERKKDGPSFFQSLVHSLSDPDPFSQLQLTDDEGNDGNGTDTDVSIDMFQYKEGRFLVVI